MNRWIPQAALVAFAALAACSDPNEIADASLTNEVDTVTVYAQSNPSVQLPSAYSIASRSPVRTWEAGINFEFIYDIDAAGRSVLIPIELLDLLPDGAFKPGLRRPTSSNTFEEMTKGPLNGYISSDTIPIVAGDRFYVRSTISTCSILGVPLYAKIQVIDFDAVAKSVRLKVLANQNCGYRGLKTGIPKS